MHRGFCFVLPLVMVVIAIVLTTTNMLRPGEYLNASAAHSSSWKAPDRQICDGLNAPAAVLRSALTKAADKSVSDPRRIDFAIETVVYFGLVALLWYFVSLEVSKPRGASSHAASLNHKLRIVKYILLIVFGIVISFAGQVVRHQFGGVTAYSNLVSIPYFTWAAVLLIFYGRRLVTSFA